MLLTIVEHRDGAVDAASADLLARAAHLDSHAEAVAISAGESLADDLAKSGIARLHTVEHDLLTGHSPELAGEAIAQLVDAVRPDGVLAPTTDRATELLAQLAARRDLPLATDCVTIEPGTTWRLTRVRAGGMLLEDAELDAEIKLVTLQAGTAEPPAVGDAAVEVCPFTPDLPSDLAHSTVVEHTQRADGVSLATAPVVVSGGRGVGSADGFATLEELAGLLGGAVGCSRVATNNGWRPHSDQVGLTGTRIGAELYIACGISGATQHWVGCMDAKRILAINTDAEAPMVTRAAYAVIGDVHAVLPAVVDELRRRGHGLRC